ncbi:MAG: alpha/beta fold hydrolase [Vicinamibacterales bacterium]
MRARWVVRIVGVVLFVLLVAATIQGTRTAIERRAYPTPGRLVDLGTHQLHLQCTGEGAPVVVLEAPAAGVSVSWGWVQPAVARVTRVCSYDRAGLGWSWRPDGEYDPDAAPAELARALEGEPGPFVVVGHGLGAGFARLFAARYPGQTAALVLVDDPTRVGTSPEDGFIARSPSLWPWLARFGVLRVDHVLSRSAVGLPEPQHGALIAFLNRPDHLMQAAQELAYADAIAERAAAASVAPVPVKQLEVLGGRRIAFLASPADADRVSTAIIDTVEALR